MHDLKNIAIRLRGPALCGAIASTIWMLLKWEDGGWWWCQAWVYSWVMGWLLVALIAWLIRDFKFKDAFACSVNIALIALLPLNFLFRSINPTGIPSWNEFMLICLLLFGSPIFAYGFFWLPHSKYKK